VPSIERVRGGGLLVRGVCWRRRTVPMNTPWSRARRPKSTTASSPPFPALKGWGRSHPERSPRVSCGKAPQAGFDAGMSPTRHGYTDSWDNRTRRSRSPMGLPKSACSWAGATDRLGNSTCWELILTCDLLVSGTRKMHRADNWCMNFCTAFDRLIASPFSSFPSAMTRKTG